MLAQVSGSYIRSWGRVSDSKVKRILADAAKNIDTAMGVVDEGAGQRGPYQPSDTAPRIPIDGTSAWI